MNDRQVTETKSHYYKIRSKNPSLEKQRSNWKGKSKIANQCFGPAPMQVVWMIIWSQRGTKATPQLSNQHIIPPILSKSDKELTRVINGILESTFTQECNNSSGKLNPSDFSLQGLDKYPSRCSGDNSSGSISLLNTGRLW